MGIGDWGTEKKCGIDLNLNFSNAENSVKSICWIISYLSWLTVGYINILFLPLAEHLKKQSSL